MLLVRRAGRLQFASANDLRGSRRCSPLTSIHTLHHYPNPIFCPQTPQKRGPIRDVCCSLCSHGRASRNSQLPKSLRQPRSIHVVAGLAHRQRRSYVHVASERLFISYLVEPYFRIGSDDIGLCVVHVISMHGSEHCGKVSARFLFLFF